MPQLDFFLFYQNIGLVAVIFGGLYLYVFMIFLPKAIFFLKLHGKLVELLKSRITKVERSSDIVFCMERQRVIFEVKKKIPFYFYHDL